MTEILCYLNTFDSNFPENPELYFFLLVQGKICIQYHPNIGLINVPFMFSICDPNIASIVTGAVEELLDPPIVLTSLAILRAAP